MANVAELVRRACFISAITPEAKIGTAGISHSNPAIGDAANCGVNEIASSINLSPSHPVHRVQVRGMRMAMEMDYQSQSHRSLSSRHGN